MDQHVMMALRTAASALGGVIVLAALILLWWKSQSPWLLLAVAAEGISLLCRLAFAIVPGVLGTTPMILLVCHGIAGSGWPARLRPRRIEPKHVISAQSTP